MSKSVNQSKYIGFIVVVAVALGMAVSLASRQSSQTDESLVDASQSADQAATNSTGRPIVSDSFNALLSPVTREMPSFELTGADGTVWNNAALEGKPWIINFWAVWCAPCIKEIPSMNRAWEKLSPEGVGMLAINIGEDAHGIERFLAEHELTIDFPVVIGDKTNTLPNWSVMALPASYIVDANGNMVYQAIGPREWDEDAILKPITDLVAR